MRIPTILILALLAASLELEAGDRTVELHALLEVGHCAVESLLGATHLQ